MSKELVTDQDKIYRLLLEDEAFTENVYRDEKGVYLLGGDGIERRYITHRNLLTAYWGAYRADERRGKERSE